MIKISKTDEIGIFRYQNHDRPIFNNKYIYNFFKKFLAEVNYVKFNDVEVIEYKY